MDTQGALEVPAGRGAFASGRAVGWPTPIFLAQNMTDTGSGPAASAPGSRGAIRPRLPGGGSMSDVPPMGLLDHAMPAENATMPSAGAAPMPTPMGAPPMARATTAQSFVPLGQVAEITVAGGPPMVRDEAGLLVGYVYIDIDQGQRDIGGYVNEAKEVIAKARESGQLKVPAGYFLKWTGQYELLLLSATPQQAVGFSPRSCWNQAST